MKTDYVNGLQTIQTPAKNKLISDNVLMTHIRRIRLPAKQDKKGPTLVIKRGPGSRPHGLEGSIEQFFCKVLTMPIPSLADWISRSLEH